MSINAMALRRVQLRIRRALNAAMIALAPLGLGRQGRGSPHVLDRLRKEQADSARREALASRQADFDEAISLLDHAIDMAERARSSPFSDL